MRRSSKALLIASVLTAGIAVAPALYANSTEDSQGSMMGQGGMMGEMGQMMKNCNKMMQSMMDGQNSEKPNEQWQKESPETPEKDG